VVLVDFAEDVLRLVERIPPGRVMSYGAIADWLGKGGPRQVGTVMARYGAGVPWHRVVTAAGRTVPGHEAEALRRLRAEGTPLRGDKVDMVRAAWYPAGD
jgi:alkylated DNA nucleotide flippase Atl1